VHARLGLGEVRLRLGGPCRLLRGTRSLFCGARLGLDRASLGVGRTRLGLGGPRLGGGVCLVDLALGGLPRLHEVGLQRLGPVVEHGDPRLGLVRTLLGRLQLLDGLLRGPEFARRDGELGLCGRERRPRLLDLGRRGRVLLAGVLGAGGEPVAILTGRLELLHHAGDLVLRGLELGAQRGRLGLGRTRPLLELRVRRRAVREFPDVGGEPVALALHGLELTLEEPHTAFGLQETLLDLRVGTGRSLKCGTLQLRLGRMQLLEGLPVLLLQCRGALLRRGGPDLCTCQLFLRFAEVGLGVRGIRTLSASQRRGPAASHRLEGGARIALPTTGGHAGDLVDRAEHGDEHDAQRQRRGAPRLGGGPERRVDAVELGDRLGVGAGGRERHAGGEHPVLHGARGPGLEHLAETEPLLGEAGADEGWVGGIDDRAVGIPDRDGVDLAVEDGAVDERVDLLGASDADRCGQVLTGHVGGEVLLRQDAGAVGGCGLGRRQRRRTDQVGDGDRHQQRDRQRRQSDARDAVGVPRPGHSSPSSSP
jgi:hypothetical protein